MVRSKLTPFVAESFEEGTCCRTREGLSGSLSAGRYPVIMLKDKRVERGPNGCASTSGLGFEV
jgi:hypothetical protein